MSSTMLRPARSGGVLSAHQDVVTRLDRLIGHIQVYRREVSTRAGLTVPQLLALRTIAELTSPTPALVAQRARLTRSNLTTVLDRLEQRGWVKRERREGDRRKVFLVLTEAGREAVDELPDPLHTLVADALQDLPDAEVEALREAMIRLDDVLGPALER